MDENLIKSKEYSKLKVRITIAQFILTIAFLFIMLVSGASSLLRDIIIDLTRSFYLQVGSYLIIFTIIYYLIFLPLDFYDSFLLEYKFHLSNETVFSWVLKNLKKALISLPILLIIGEALYFLLRHFPDSWWLLLTVVWLLITVVLSKIAPVLIIPIFYKCKPLASSELQNKLVELGNKCGVRIKGAFEIKISKDTKKANAAVVGFGRGRRILLGDTLLANYTEDEIEAVFAHELGHIRMFHIVKILGFGAIISLVCFFIAHLLLIKAISLFGFSYIYDIAVFPLILLVLLIIGLILMPIQNAYMRYLEKQADLFALDQIQNNESFVSAITKLGDQNLSDPSPSKFVELFLFTHPPISKRLRYSRNK